MTWGAFFLYLGAALLGIVIASWMAWLWITSGDRHSTGWRDDGEGE